MIFKEVILLSALVISSNAFWWTSSGTGQSDTESIETPAIQPVPVGYFRFYTYQPLVPVASSRSYVPYQSAPRYINDVGYWGPRVSNSPLNNGEQKLHTPHSNKLTLPAIPSQNSNYIKHSQTTIPTTSPPIIEEAPSTKVVPITTTTTTTTTASTSTTSSPLSTINDVPLNHIDISESSSALFSHDNSISQLAPAAHSVPFAQYSQPLPEHPQVPFVSNYQSQPVQYMPCMCPVSLGFTTPELLPNKPIESREDSYEIQAADNFE